MAHLLLPPLNATNLFGNTDASLPYCGESFWTTLFALFLLKGAQDNPDSFQVNVYERNSSNSSAPYYQLRRESPHFAPGAISMRDISIEPPPNKTQEYLAKQCGGLRLPCFGISPDIVIRVAGKSVLTLIECKISGNMQSNQLDNYKTVVSELKALNVQCQLLLLASKGMANALDIQVRHLQESLDGNFGLILWEDVLLRMIETKFDVPGVDLNQWRRYSCLEPEVSA